MTLHVLVEGPSERAFLERWAPRLLGDQSVKIHPHQGKGSLPADLDARPEKWRRGLLDQLPATLRGFEAALDLAVDAVLVLVDADNDDPPTFVSEILAAAQRVAPKLRLAVRLAVEEFEAFYLGDLRALQRAFPKARMKSARAYKPDSICGTWELFGKIIGDGGGNKVGWAEAMGPHVTTRPERSRSPSFKAMVAAFIELVPPPPAPSRRRAWHHSQRPHNEPGRRR